jgi:hypothetical protein
LLCAGLAALTACISAASLTGCGDAAEDPSLPSDDNGPGTKAWNDDDVGCTSDADCSAGEVCGDGVCQMQRCTDPAYASVAPLGAYRYFGLDREIALVGDDTYVDGYESADGGYLASWEIGEKLTDVVGGNLLGTRPQALAAAVELSDEVRIQGADGESTLSVGIWPIALAAGDVDADGIEELISLGHEGSISVCHVTEGTCQVVQLTGATGVSIAAGDVDGDGFDEPVVLVDRDGTSEIVVWNTDHALTEQEELVAWSVNKTLSALGVGDVDGDGLAEAMVLEDGGLWGWANDVLHVFSPAQGAILASPSVDAETIDVDAGDRDGDGRAEVVMLRGNATFELVGIDGAGTLTSLVTASLAVGQGATRIATVDWDGDSPAGRLISGPELVSGAVVPVALMIFPPYDRAAQTKGSADVMVGNNAAQSETMSDTVSLHLGLTVGYGADIAGVVKASVSGYLYKDLSSTKAVTRSISVGQRFSIEADPEVLGDDYAGVVLSCGCFHAYAYETDDPAGKVGGSGKEMRIFVPVGGQTGLWSSKRYAAMAEALGGLPEMTVPYRIGDVSSYPPAHQTLAGQPIPEGDRVFPEPPSFQVSDVGTVGFWLTSTESEANTVAETTTIGLSGTLGAFGASVTGDINTGFAHAYTVTVGEEALFAGSVPPLVDNPDTPEDEFQTYRYSFSPTVYREHYADAAGEDAGYYVVTYAVGQ